MSRHNDVADLYIGTYTEGRREGIYHFRLTLSTGELEQVSAYDGGENPSYLAAGRDGRCLYAVNEVEQFGGEPGGGVSTFAIGAEGGLSPMRSVSSGGKGPCHISAGPDGRSLLVSNYADGSLATLPLGDDGAPGPVASVVRHHGSGVDRERQESPHIHCALADLAGRFVLAADLGTDRIAIYRLDRLGLRLEPTDQAAEVKEGSGPRHFLFHPNGRLVFLVTELDSTVISLAYDPDLGTLREIGTISTLPERFAGDNLAAAIRISPAGDRLYVSNRGDDSIAVLGVDQRTGALSLTGHRPCGGRGPRDIVIDPTGRLLVVANEKSNRIATFVLDPATGLPEPTGGGAEVPRPSSALIVPEGFQ